MDAAAVEYNNAAEPGFLDCHDDAIACRDRT